jgi:hypothetical protein
VIESEIVCFLSARSAAHGITSFRWHQVLLQRPSVFPQATPTEEAYQHERSCSSISTIVSSILLLFRTKIWFSASSESVYPHCSAGHSQNWLTWDVAGKLCRNLDKACPSTIKSASSRTSANSARNHSSNICSCAGLQPHQRSETSIHREPMDAIDPGPPPQRPMMWQRSLSKGCSRQTT